MHTTALSLLLALFAVPRLTAASPAGFIRARPDSIVKRQTQYHATDSWVGSQFYDGFQFFNQGDPTHGRVNYIDQATAQNLNLTHATSSSFVMAADSTTVLDPNGPGRNAIRIQSNNQYSTHVVVLDLAHMPEGCGTWPAFWETGANWPSNGEVDIIEGVNDESPNLTSLHTSPGCGQPASGRTMKGTPGGLDCSAADNGNQGCGVSGDSPASFGPQFNQAGGGWYAMERTSSTITVWFWGRNDPNVPSEVSQPGSALTPANWGTPTATFVSDQCNIGSDFGPNNIIINLTFCGDWAGSVFNNAPACSSFGSCVGTFYFQVHQQNLPEAFRTFSSIVTN